ncbi:MAG TPA: YbhB/YbcL family Raf kinase inhibitor-like protein [Longimicrobiales bacterium]
MRSRVASALATVLVPLLACSAGQKGAPMTLTITSPAFAANASIPSQFTCEGPNISPELKWSGVPAQAKSLALIVDDPDAPDPAHPKTTWVHWVAYDIPVASAGVPENAGKLGVPGARAGKNDFGDAGWGGPCPPIGRHRYFFRLFALDTQLGDLGQPDRAALDKAMKGHILAQGELVGTYQKTRK